MVGSISGRNEDKFIKTGLTPMKSKKIKSVLVKECPVNLECRIVHQIQYSGSHTWFIGEILIAHIDEDYSRESALMYWLREYRRVGDLIFKVKR
jgi:flavin reductase (DIM6/NTAB) family NADH-FMN oxidoreductase RutF